jgi:hypothetical protein
MAKELSPTVRRRVGYQREPRGLSGKNGIVLALQGLPLIGLFMGILLLTLQGSLVILPYLSVPRTLARDSASPPLVMALEIVAPPVLNHLGERQATIDEDFDDKSLFRKALIANVLCFPLFSALRGITGVTHTFLWPFRYFIRPQTPRAP